MAGHYITTNQVGNSWCPQIRFEVWTIREDDKYVYYDFTIGTYIMMLMDMLHILTDVLDRLVR